MQHDDRRVRACDSEQIQLGWGSLLGPPTVASLKVCSPELGCAAEQYQRDEYRETRHMFSSARATATKVASQPGPPTIDKPTGSPSIAAPGMLTCGTPVSPP